MPFPTTFYGELVNKSVNKSVNKMSVNMTKVLVVLIRYNYIGGFMPTTHTSRRGLVKNTVALLSVLTLLFTYNNCGERGFETQQDSSEVVKIEHRLAVKHADKISANMCEQSESYKCIHRIFSQDVENYEVELDYPCTNISGSDLCVHGKQYGFDTAQAALDCGDNCTEKFEYEEFSCYLDLKDDESKYPISGESDNFETALKTAVAGCQKFISGLKK
jgi:hypothetical protein